MSEISEFNQNKLAEKLEALLFVAATPVPYQQLADAIKVSTEDVKKGLKKLADHYKEGHGLSLIFHENSVQIATNAEYAEIIEAFLGLEAVARLSRAALETLSIIAYRQPITRPGIDAIRGVNSDGVLKSLLGKGLVQEAGRTEGPGRPIIYETTVEFLQHFGLSSLEELPPFELLEDVEAGQNGNGILKD
jgi:segregation and condensation protein B